MLYTECVWWHEKRQRDPDLSFRSEICHWYEKNQRYPNLSFRAKRGISPSITDRLNYEILRFAQDDNLEQGASFRAVSRNEPAPFHTFVCGSQPARGIPMNQSPAYP